MQMTQHVYINILMQSHSFFYYQTIYCTALGSMKEPSAWDIYVNQYFPQLGASGDSLVYDIYTYASDGCSRLQCDGSPRSSIRLISGLGPPPCRHSMTSAISRAFPIMLPIGLSIRLKIAVVLTPCRFATDTCNT
jgi:hypothetical protein